MVNPVNSLAVQVTWSPPASKNGIILEYQVNYVGYKAKDKPPVRTLCTAAHLYFSLILMQALISMAECIVRILKHLITASHAITQDYIVELIPYLALLLAQIVCI